MNIKDTKITWFVFLAYECAAAEEYLELMAEKGWLLQSIKGAFLKFKKIEPQKIKYSVDVFDHKDSDVVLEYREYCQTAGWNYICRKGEIQIFYTEEDEKIVSIHTDEAEKFKSVFKASLWYEVGQFSLTLALIFNLYMEFFLQPTDIAIESNVEILSLITIFFIILINIIGVVRFCFWVMKAKGHLKENKYMPYNSYKQIMIKSILTKSYALIILILMLKFSGSNNKVSNEINISLLIIIGVPIIILIFIHKFIDRKRFSTNTNIPITIFSTLLSIYLVLTLSYAIVFSRITAIEQSKVKTEKVSLTVVDFGFEESNTASPYTSYDRSILGQRIQYTSSNEEEELNYIIYESQYPWVINYKKVRLLSGHSKYHIGLNQENTSLPSNIKVYSNSQKKQFLVVSEDKIVDIFKRLDGISEDEFLKKVYEKLFS
ncbi:MAG: DUF2812 domain-containing protein [Clostridiaceae bacterium]|nr:DUF2812 domain-containing protein [Clostridiaceae bacterium]